MQSKEMFEHKVNVSVYIWDVTVMLNYIANH